MKPPVPAVAAIAAILSSVTTGARTAAAEEDRSIVSVALGTSDGRAPQAGQPVTLTIRARDPGSDYPLTGLSPAAWLVPDTGDADGCQAWVNRLAGSPVPPPGVADLNGYDIVQLARDGTLALIDPRLNLATANIRSLIRLPALPARWAIDPAGTTLAIVPGEAPSKVRLIGYSPLAVRSEIDARAMVTALSAGDTDLLAGTADGRLLRVSRDGRIIAAVALGTGAVILQRDDDGGLIAMAQDGHGLIEGDGGRSVRFAGVAGGVRSVAYASLADAAYVLAANGRSLSIIHRDAPGALFSVPLEVEAARIVPDRHGRWSALPASDGRSVAILDTRVGAVRWTIATEDPVRDVVFSDSFLYLSHARAGGVTRVVFDPDGGAPGVAMIAAGEAATSDRDPSPMPLVVRVPGNGIIAASPDRRVGFMVAEDGAQAAMSSVPLLAGDTAGLLLRYRGMREIGSEGTYRTEFVPQHGGRYMAVVRINRPALAHCRAIAIGGSPDPALLRQTAVGAAPAAALRLLSAPRPGEPDIRFALEGAPPGVRLVNAMLMATTGSWHRFVAVRPDGEGRYRFRASVPQRGLYRFYAELGGTAAGQTLGMDVPIP